MCHRPDAEQSGHCSKALGRALANLKYRSEQYRNETSGERTAVGVPSFGSVVPVGPGVSLPSFDLLPRVFFFPTVGHALSASSEQKPHLMRIRDDKAPSIDLLHDGSIVFV